MLLELFEDLGSLHIVDDGVEVLALFEGALQVDYKWREYGRFVVLVNSEASVLNRLLVDDLHGIEVSSLLAEHLVRAA